MLNRAILLGPAALLTLMVVSAVFQGQDAPQYQAASTPGWGQDVRLTNDSHISRLSFNYAQSVAADAFGRVHVVWYDDRMGMPQLYYKRSSNDGSSWGQDIRLSPSSMIQALPAVATSGSTVYITWMDFRNMNYDIFFKRSTNGGSSWGPDVRLTTNPNDSRNPAIAVSGSNVYLVWTDARDGQDEIYFRASSNSGTTWGVERRLTDLPFSSWTPTITVSGSTIHVFWVDTRDGNEEEYYTRSTDGGQTWSVNTRLTIDAAMSWGPSAIALSNNMVHLVWFDNRPGNWAIYYNRSFDRGVTWGPDIRLTDDTVFDSLGPTVAASGNNVHVVWTDKRDLNTEIYYQTSSDGGVTWQAETRLTNAVSDSVQPHIIDAANFLHLVWYDSRPGNFEIYYKRYVK